MLRYERAQFEYEPYPIGLLPEVFEPGFYRELAATYPPSHLFKHMPMLGNKYSLSEVNHPHAYHAFLRESPGWGRFHAYVKSPEFVEHAFEMLRSNHVELGLKRYRVASNVVRRKASRLNRFRGIAELSARFEFSMMNGRGGHIRPHTDDPRKLVTFVFSCMLPGEWDAAWGGSTAIVWPKKPEDSFNHTNRYLEFDEVNVLRAYPFQPNQALVFIKTFNSWHAVPPMTAPVEDALRKTLTVNIERRRP